MTIYELTDEYRRLMELAEDPEVEVDILADTIEALDGEIEAKADGYGRVIKNLEADISGIHAEEARLARRRRAMESNLDHIKDALLWGMRECNKPSIKTDLFGFRIQKNPASVEIDPDAVIPDEYLIPQEPKVDRQALKDALKAGEMLEGIRLVQTERVQIR